MDRQVTDWQKMSVKLFHMQIQKWKDKEPSKKIRNGRNRLFSVEETPVGPNHMKLFPASLGIREMQIKTTT